MNRLCKLITLCICLAAISPVFAGPPPSNVVLYGNVFLSNGTPANGATYNISVYDDSTGDLLSTTTGLVGEIVSDIIYESQNTPNSAGDIFVVAVVFVDETGEWNHAITLEEFEVTIVNMPDMTLSLKPDLIVTNISLAQDWNLISIPLEQSNWSLTSVLAPIEGKYNVVFAYIDGGWKRSTSTRAPLTEMSREYGYWINMSEPATLTVSGWVPSVTTINVSTGWNLVGYPSLTVQDLATVLSQINYTVVFEYRNGGWKRSTALRSPLTHMSPGYGYWIYANDTTPPTWYQTPTNQAVEVNTAFTYDVNAFDPGGIDTYSVNDTNFAIDASGIITNNTILLLGTYDLNISVNDTSNNVLSAVITVTVQDTTSPVITIISPEDGIILSPETATVTINVSITESNPSILVLNWEGENISYGSYSGPYESITMNVFAGNSYIFYVWANDTAGNMNVSETRSVTVNYTVMIDTDPPSIVFTDQTPVNGTVTGDNHMYLNTSIGDESGITSFIDWNRSLTGYWRFEEEAGSTVGDSSTSRNNGTIYGAAHADGKFGKALNFDGNDYVEIENPDLNLVNEITIEAWVKPVLGSRGPVAARYVYNYSIPVNDRSFEFSISSGGNVEFALSSSGTGATWLTSSGAVSDGAWNHVVATSDGTTMRIYINGVLDSTTAPAPSVIYSPERPIQIGAWIYGVANETDNEYFNGIIDEVKIHSRALSPQEINASYDSNLYGLERNFTSLDNGSYTYYAYAQDAAGNYNCTETRIITVEFQEGQDDPPPDSGGGGTSATVSVVEAEKAVTFAFSEAESEFVSEIVLTTKQAHYNAKITVQIFKGKPYASLPDPEGVAYKYLEITTSNIPATGIDKADVKFKVEVAWLKENDINPSTVALNRNVQSRWDVLATAKTWSDDTYVYYTAETPGFSHFAITADEGSGYLEEVVPIETHAPTIALQAATPAPTMPALTTPTPTAPPATTVAMPTPSMPPTKVGIALILMVVIAVGGYVFVRERKV